MQERLDELDPRPLQVSRAVREVIAAQCIVATKSDGRAVTYCHATIAVA